MNSALEQRLDVNIRGTRMYPEQADSVKYRSPDVNASGVRGTKRGSTRGTAGTAGRVSLTVAGIILMLSAAGLLRLDGDAC